MNDAQIVDVCCDLMILSVYIQCAQPAGVAL